MKKIYVEYYNDRMNKIDMQQFIAKRFYIDTSGALLIIDNDEEVINAFANSVWRFVS